MLVWKLLLSISHGHSVPDRGFSVSKYLLQVHGFSTLEKTTEALKFVEDEICRVGGIMKFQINTELLSSAKDAHGWYVADLEAERELREKEEHEKKKAQTEKEDSERHCLKTLYLERNSEVYKRLIWDWSKNIN